MKKKIILGAVIVVLLVVGFAGCDLLNSLLGLGTSVSARITAFETDLNTDSRTDTYKNFHPTETTQYDNMKTATWWDSSPFSTANRDFTLTAGTPSDESSSGRVTVTVTIKHGNDATGSDATFTMLEEEAGGGNWLIEEISWNSLSIRKID